MLFSILLTAVIAVATFAQAAPLADAGFVFFPLVLATCAGGAVHNGPFFPCLPTTYHHLKISSTS